MLYEVITQAVHRLEHANRNILSILLGNPVELRQGLAIGVSNYSSSSINLRYADQDALNLEKFFKSQQGKSFSEIHFA